MAEIINENELTEISGGKGQNRIGFKYVVKKNDSLGKIASRYHTSVAEIMSYNKNITNADMIGEGQVIIVPGEGIMHK